MLLPIQLRREVNKLLSLFRVSNYKSIRVPMTLDLKGTSINEHQEHLIRLSDEEEYLPVAAIYGPNGGGKSNILKAIGALRNKVMAPIYTVNGSVRDFTGMHIRPFDFTAKNKDIPTEFEIYFVAGGYEYNYALAICNGTVSAESLKRRRLGVERWGKLFERNGSDIVLKSDLQRQKISVGLSTNIPLLSYLGITYSRNSIVNDVISWFEQKISLLSCEKSILDMPATIELLQQKKNLILQMFQELDLDIADFRIEKISEQEFDIYTKHIVDDYCTELNLSEESAGMQKLFVILPHIAHSLVSGSALVIDDLDSNLHPLLMRFLVDKYTDPEINRRRAQLIFTSHDVSLMTSDCFRRDEIWFAAKGTEQDTVLYSLADLGNDGEVHKNLKYGRQYLDGEYKAIPYLQRIIDWDVVDSGVGASRKNSN